MSPGPNIGRVELQILQYVQDHHPISVRVVAEHFAEQTGCVRTTILNVLERLRLKGHLKRKKIDGIYHYAPSRPKGEFVRLMVREFVERALGGSVSPFMAYLTQEARISDEELKELKKLVRELERKEEHG